MVLEQVPVLYVRAGLIRSPSYARRRERLEVWLGVNGPSEKRLCVND